MPTTDPNVIARRARKAHTCIRCGGEIAPGEKYFEYVGEAPAYASGSRYHAACALAEGLTTEATK